MTLLRRFLVFSPVGQVAALVVLLLVVGIAGAWAADSSIASFPMLGVGDAQRQSLMTGFQVQWALFSQFSGQKAGALYYLALTAAVVGIMLVVTQPKYRSAGVLIPWFLILTVLLFAPYNSRLLFYPINGSNEQSSSSGNCVASGSGSGSAAFNGVCGFTPQLLATHLGSVLTLIVTDVMESAGLKNAVSAAFARVAVEKAPEMKATPDSTKEINNFLAQDTRCGKAPLRPSCYYNNSNSTSTGSAASQSASGGASSQPSSLNLADTLGGVWAEIDRKMAAGNGNETTLPAIVLPKSCTEALTMGYSPTQWSDYEKSFETLWKTVVSDSSQRSNADKITNTPVSGNSCQSQNSPVTGQVSMETAVNDFLKYIRSHQSSYRINPFSGTQTGVRDDAGSLSYYFTTADTVDELKNVRAKYGTTLLTDYESSDGLTSRVPTLKNLIRSDSGIANLPVGKGVVSFVPGQSGSSSVNVLLPPASCRDVASSVFSSVLQKQLDIASTGSTGGATGNGVYTSNSAGRTLYDKMMKCEDITTAELAGLTGTNADFAKNLLNYASAEGGTLKGADLAELMSSRLQRSAQSQREGQLAARAQKLPENTGVTGSGWGVGQFLGGVAQSLGLGIAGGLGYLFGLLATATLMIMKGMIDMGLMLLIVVTPFMFIMGIMIPTNAPGMLATTTLGMLVLTLVPMTLKIIDYLVGLMQGLVSSYFSGAGGDVFSAAAWNGIVLFAASGLYMSAISMTLFLMFKLGDSNNLLQLRSIEGAAKQVAEVGAKVVTAVGLGLATVGAGGLVGAFTGNKGAAAMISGSSKLGRASGMIDKIMADEAAKSSPAATAQPSGPAETTWTDEKISEAESELAKLAGVSEEENAFIRDAESELANLVSPEAETDLAKLADMEEAKRNGFATDDLTLRMGQSAGGWDKVNESFRQQVDMGNGGEARKVSTKDGTYTVGWNEANQSWRVDRFEPADGSPAIERSLARNANPAGTQPTPPKDGDIPPEVVPGDVLPTSTAAAAKRTPAGYVAESDENRFNLLSSPNRQKVDALKNGEAVDVQMADGTKRTWTRTVDGKLRQEGSVEDDVHAKQFGDMVKGLESSVVAAIKQGFDQVTANRMGEANKDAPLRRNAEFKGLMESLIKEGALTRQESEHILNSSTYQEAMHEIDTMRFKKTEYLEKIGVGRNADDSFNMASARWRGATKGARSGMYGAIQAFKNAGGSLPIIGPIVKEIINEDREAHDRAVVIAMHGGLKEYKRSQKLAERQSFVSKEMSTIGSAESYRTTPVQAQYSNTIQAARQGAAKAMEDFTARARTGRTDATGAFSVSDLRANARMGAISDATAISTHAMNIKTLQVPLQGGRSVSLNPAVLQHLAERGSVKDSVKKVNSQFETGYAVQPKMDKSGVSNFKDAQQVASYSKDRIGLDYIWGGVVDNHSGRVSGTLKEMIGKEYIRLSGGNMASPAPSFNQFYKLNATFDMAKKVGKFTTDPNVPRSKKDRKLEDLEGMIAEIAQDVVDDNK